MNNNPQDKKPKIRLEMLSDWHIGTGAGVPGSTDALIARDGEGFPCVPAKSLVGIWRDALETLSRGLDNGTGEDWQKWVEVIFGSQPNQLKEDEIKNLANRNKLQPRPSIIKIRPARIDENLRQAIKGDKQLEQALTFIKPNTRIDADSGTAETESLRFTEMGRIGTVLEAEFELDLENFNSRQQELILTLLAASAGLVERIGGNRRRGSGKCAMSLDAKSLSEAVNCLRKNDLDLNAPDYKPEDKDFETNGATSDENDWRKIEFELKLHTPVAIVTATLGNVSETLDFIPGTYLLPHITKKLGKGISKHIAAGDFQVLPATIAITTEIRKKDDETFEEIKTRGLSVPKVIWYHKTDGGFDKEIEGGYDKKQEGKKPTVYNKIEESAKVEDLTYQKKNFREGYISSLDENGKQLPFYETTPKILLMHNTVKDDIQRPHEDVGGVFSREAIKAGTTLRGEIRFKKSLADEVKKLEKYTSYVRLGTSKKDDYGYTELTFETLSEIPSNPTVASELIVYLASDVLLRNDNLRQTNLVEDLKKELEKTLGTGKLKSLDNVLEELKAELEKNPDSEEIKEKIKKAKERLVSPIQVRRIESWHEGWGFPRPTFTAMSAGSVAVFEVAGTIKNDDLKNLELSGIGERRGEGYGQIKFNPKILTEQINNWTTPTKNNENGGEAKARRAKARRAKARNQLKTQLQNADRLKKFIETIEFATWRGELARAVLKIANEPSQREEIFGFGFKGKESIPPMSQIGSLRSTVGKLKKVEIDNDSESVVTNWLKHLEETSNRLKKWGDNENSAKANLKKIKHLVQSKTLVWQKLKDFWQEPETLTTDENSLKENLWTEAVKSLFDACARAHKRDLERKQEKQEDENNG